MQPSYTSETIGSAYSAGMFPHPCKIRYLFLDRFRVKKIHSIKNISCASEYGPKDPVQIPSSTNTRGTNGVSTEHRGIVVESDSASQSRDKWQEIGRVLDSIHFVGKIDLYAGRWGRSLESRRGRRRVET